MKNHTACPLRQCGTKSYYCPVELSIQVIGGKWKPIIIFHLHRGGTLRFSELRRSMPNITQKMLTRQLRELEADGMVQRVVYPEVPPRVEYSLTDLGASIMPALDALGNWGGHYERMMSAQEAPEDKTHGIDMTPACT
ncbi:DNA-binding HxlR family transcriptional regulator [Desulfobaculum xiamenense]|uniref:DNA-binding HxlR family transcriptional regulator n=1 Tax=Desulfobaculum xiamenense TaxID=995050 RepID=A0A846QPG4_9BACT|nr:helix-turn-helix domain-containing protein [Desulfobaculum xiamenense]NJB68382.1 DNA-binding HxlR family transcriptional regulator [Desulfobaculum xiamenense]